MNWNRVYEEIQRLHFLTTLGYLLSQVSTNLLILLVIIIDVTVRRLEIHKKTWNYFRNQKFWRRLRSFLILLFRKKINKLVLFTCRNLYRFHICLNHREAFLATQKTRLLQTHIEKFSQHIWKFRFTNLQNRHWNKMNTKQGLVREGQKWLNPPFKYQQKAIFHGYFQTKNLTLRHLSNRQFRE